MQLKFPENMSICTGKEALCKHMLTFVLLHYCKMALHNVLHIYSTSVAHTKATAHVGAHECLWGKGAKKNKEKKPTSVSFAFTHTYTPVKTNIFPFFPKRTWKILKNVQKRKNYP